MESSNKNIKKQKVCELCQAIFECCTEKCWCSELPNIMEMNKDGDCLCPACLGEAIEKKQRPDY